MERIDDKRAQQKWSSMSREEPCRAIDRAMKDAEGYGSVESVMGGQVEPDAPCSPLLLAGLI